MKHYLYFTDTNSRQYPFEIPESGLSITDGVQEVTITQEGEGFDVLIDAAGTIMINNQTILDLNKIVAIQIHHLADDAC